MEEEDPRSSAVLQPQQRLQGGMGPVPERPPVPGLCPGHPPCSDGSSRLRMKAVTAARRRLLRALCARRGVQKRTFQDYFFFPFEISVASANKALLSGCWGTASIWPCHN